MSMLTVNGMIMPVCTICSRNPCTRNYNYGVESCGGCKTFFRRSIMACLDRKITPAALYECDHPPGQLDQNNISKNNSMCKYCRLNKCLDIGMQPGNLQKSKPKVKEVTVKLTQSQSSPLVRKSPYAIFHRKSNKTLRPFNPGLATYSSSSLSEGCGTDLSPFTIKDDDYELSMEDEDTVVVGISADGTPTEQSMSTTRPKTPESVNTAATSRVSVIVFKNKEPSSSSSETETKESQDVEMTGRFSMNPSKCETTTLTPRTRVPKDRIRIISHTVHSTDKTFAGNVQLNSILADTESLDLIPNSNKNSHRHNRETEKVLNQSSTEPSSRREFSSLPLTASTVERRHNDPLPTKVAVKELLNELAKIPNMPPINPAISREMVTTLEVDQPAQEQQTKIVADKPLLKNLLQSSISQALKSFPCTPSVPAERKYPEASVVEQMLTTHSAAKLVLLRNNLEQISMAAESCLRDPHDDVTSVTGSQDINDALLARDEQELKFFYDIIHKCSISKLTGRLKKFVSRLPGFTYLLTSDQDKLIDGSQFTFWVVHCSRYWKPVPSLRYDKISAQSTHLHPTDRLVAGMNKVLNGDGLPDPFIDKVLARLVCQMAQKISDLNLSLVELAVLGAIVLTRPISREYASSFVITALHNHYMEILLMTLRDRRDISFVEYLGVLNIISKIDNITSSNLHVNSKMVC